MRSRFRYYYPRDWLDWFLGTLLAVSAVALVAGVTLLVQDCSAQDRCEAGGGRIERYNHHTVLVPVSAGKTTILMPEDASDWRCVK